MGKHESRLNRADKKAPFTKDEVLQLRKMAAEALKPYIHEKWIKKHILKERTNA